MTQLRSFLFFDESKLTLQFFFLLWICFRYETAEKREKKMKWRKNAPENTKKKKLDDSKPDELFFVPSTILPIFLLFESNTLEFVDEKHDSKAINFIIITSLRSLVALSCCPHVDYLFSRGRTRAVLLFMSQVSHIFFCVCLSGEMKSDGKGDELAENEVEDGRRRRSRLEDRKKSEGK